MFELLKSNVFLCCRVFLMRLTRLTCTIPLKVSVALP